MLAVFHWVGLEHQGNAGMTGTGTTAYPGDRYYHEHGQPGYIAVFDPLGELYSRPDETQKPTTSELASQQFRQKKRAARKRREAGRVSK